MYQKMTHTLEDLKKLAAMELRDVNREERCVNQEIPVAARADG